VTNIQLLLAKILPKQSLSLQKLIEITDFQTNLFGLQTFIKMKSTLHEIYLHRSDDPMLVEHYEESFQVEQHLRMDYYHFVFLETSSGLHFIHTEGASEQIPKLNIEFSFRLEQLENLSIDELCFLIAMFELDCRIKEISIVIPNSAIDESTIPKSILQLIQPTKGYLIYREQGEAFFQLATGCDERIARIWIADARLKKKNVLDEVRNLKIEGFPSTYFDYLFPPNGGLPYLIQKPEQQALKLLEYLKLKIIHYLNQA
jgi:hypothetical protein